MKKYLKDIEDSKELLSVILSKKKLSEMLYNRISSSEIDFYLDDKLRCFKRGTIDYEIGVYNRNYFRLTNDDYGTCYDFLCGVEDSIASFDGTDKLKRLAGQCRKLINSNLFCSKVKQLCELYYDEEIEPIVKFVEDCSYDIYCKNSESKNLLDYADLFWEDYGDAFYIEDGEVYEVAKPIK